MPDPEVERAARFLATHAVLLLGLAITAGVLALVAVVVIVRAFDRFRDPLQRAYAGLVDQARTVRFIDSVIHRTRRLVPGGYLALHLLLGLVLTAATMAFVVIAEDALGDGSMAAFDVVFAAALQETATPGWHRAFEAISWMGQGWVLAVLAGLMAILLLARGQTMVAVAWLAAQAGGGLLNRALKETFERTRPEFADPLLATTSWSFPSGHAMGTFVLCGLGCYILAREARSWTLAGVAVFAGVAWCVVMSFSRLYLGVHYASDVIAGIVAGAAWVAVCASGLEALRRRSAVSASSRAQGPRLAE